MGVGLSTTTLSARRMPALSQSLTLGGGRKLNALHISVNSTEGVKGYVLSPLSWPIINLALTDLQPVRIYVLENNYSFDSLHQANY